MPSRRELSTIERTKDETKLKAKASVDKDLLQALTSEDGPMRPGALPQVKAQGPGAAKKLYDALGEAWLKLNIDSLYFTIKGFAFNSTISTLAGRC